MNPISFYIVTDTHYFEPSLGVEGAAYDAYMKREQICLAENSAIARATFAEIARDSETNIVIIPGDLTKNGEMESHKSFIRELEGLKNAGKKVYVITALHDFNDAPVGYVGEERVPVEGTKRSELQELYNDFGYSEAIAFDEESLSYVAELAPGVRMLALNCDGDSTIKGGFDERLQGWIKEQAEAARRDDCFVFAIDHYPIIPPVPVFEFVSDAKVKQWRKIAALLADSGVGLIFTGHMHIQSINEFVSEKGNRLVDICTSALVGSPAKYRKISIDSDGVVDVKSFAVPSFDWDMRGLTNREFFDERFNNAVVTRINEMLDGSAVKRKVRKFINTATIGRVGKLLRLPVDESIRDRKFIDFVTEIGRGIFAGDQAFTEGTLEYEMIAFALKKYQFIIKRIEPKLEKDGNKIDLTSMLLETIGSNGFTDNDAVIGK